MLVLRNGKFQFPCNQTDRLFCRLPQAERRPEGRYCLSIRTDPLVLWTRQGWSVMPWEAMSSAWFGHVPTGPRASNKLEVGDLVFLQRGTQVSSWAGWFFLDYPPGTADLSCARCADMLQSIQCPEPVVSPGPWTKPPFASASQVSGVWILPSVVDF